MHHLGYPGGTVDWTSGEGAKYLSDVDRNWAIKLDLIAKKKAKDEAEAKAKAEAAGKQKK
jgi:hypothetical protein